ncbi:Chromosomal replication initiator protein DnaA [Serinibacter arcticus]|uniref:Chromosomal replication initiator protein DnaA n=2 Tax=Serinibacter arcticus TaxID=1655435 RepID=A0A4Z1E5Y7_9MICO|nr:Chromosomal replication initiator protein DnaA [Serinibacter arcticus]
MGRMTVSDDALSDLDQSWTHVVERLRNMLPPSQHAFVRLTKPLGVLNGTLLIAAPSDFAKEFLETRAREEITSALTEILGERLSLAVTIDPSLLDADPSLAEDVDYAASDEPARSPSHRDTSRLDDVRRDERHRDRRDRDDRDRDDRERDDRDHRDRDRDRDEPAHLRRDDDNRASRRAADRRQGLTSADPNSPGNDSARLNQLYTFDTFVTGSSNRFANAAAFAVAEAPAKAYNPLFIYGDSGLGKTHLLHAIGHYAQRLYPGVRVRYVNSEEFTNDFINSIRDDKAESFQRRYRSVDVLLIDDIQFLQGKKETMEEFFHTFNSLHNSNKQVVITSDVAPKYLDGFADRMRSRFEWGLITDIQPPDLETRIAILRKKAGREQLSAPDDVLSYIGSRISTNIRELEGALIRVTAFANLNGQPVDLPLAEMVLKDLITEEGDAEITPAIIMAQTSTYFGVSIEALCSADRTRVLVNARQIAMYLCRELTDLSLPKIGQIFGGRDHTTVMHADRKIRELMAKNRSTFTQITELTNRIKQQNKL